MRVAIYVRVSTQRQAEAQTIDEQIERLRGHAGARGWELPEANVFRDDGYSGATLRRPGLDRLRDTAAMAAFDVITNNTDRKGGHVLAMTDGRRLGVDHGICFHVDDKLRTVLWGFAGQRLDDPEVAAVEGLLDALDAEEEFGFLLTAEEIDRTRDRARRLLRDGLPLPGPAWRSIPWPPF